MDGGRDDEQRVVGLVRALDCCSSCSWCVDSIERLVRVQMSAEGCSDQSVDWLRCSSDVHASRLESSRFEGLCLRQADRLKPSLKK